MTLQDTLENVNEPTVFVCFCLFCWTLLMSAKADAVISLPYWVLFSPLWLWKIVAISGWLSALVVWIRQKRSYAERDAATYSDTTRPYIHALTVSLFFNLLIACSEVLLCIRLSLGSGGPSYLTIITPLLLVGSLGVFAFLFVMIDSRSSLPWSQTRRRSRRNSALRSVGMEDSETYAGGPVAVSNSPPVTPTVVYIQARRICTFTLELCIAANFLQLLFLIARLDKWINSTWIITFIPSYILISMALLFCLVGFIVALIRCLSSYFIPMEHTRLPIYYYASQIVIDVLLGASIVLLGLRLDNYAASFSLMSYTLIATPFLVSLLLYGVNALYSGPGNLWWFGLNRTVLVAIFELNPSLQLCANTSFTASSLWKRPPIRGSEEDVAQDASESGYPSHADGRIPVGHARNTAAAVDILASGQAHLAYSSSGSHRQSNAIYCPD